jgi:hypothetical protein
MIGKMHGNVKYFVFFWNLINILDFGADINVTLNVKVKIWGFLQPQKPTNKTAIQTLLSQMSPH